MATVRQALKASIEFGGKLAPSWTGSVKAMEKGVGLLTARSRQMAAEQRALASRIREMTKEGKNVSTLQHHYDHLTKSIKETEKAQAALNGKLGSARLRESLMGGAKSGLKGAGKGMLKGGLTAGAWMGGGLIAGAAGALASPIMLNQETSEKAGLAKSYGVDASTFMAWEGMGKMMGLNGENIGDLFEEFKNKVSDYHDDNTKGAIAEAFPVLGVKAGEMRGLNNQQQVEKIFGKLMAMKDDQRAAGIADKLFGGEGNKILTYMRLTGKSYEELMDQQKKYNMVTKEGADGAVAGNMAVSNLWQVLTTAGMEISGQLGGELGPSITGIADKLSSWLKDGGIDSIKSIILDDVIPGAVSFGKGLVYVGEVAFALARKLNWLLPDEKEQAQQKQQLINQVASGNSSPELVASMAKDLGLEDWFKGLNLDTYKTSQLRMQWDESHSGKDGATKGASPEEQKKLMAIADPEAASRQSLSDLLQHPPSLTEPSTPIANSTAGLARDQKGNVHNEWKPNVNIQVIQQPGEDGETLANRVGLAFKDTSSAGTSFTPMSDPVWSAN